MEPPSLFSELLVAIVILPDTVPPLLVVIKKSPPLAPDWSITAPPVCPKAVSPAATLTLPPVCTALPTETLTVPEFSNEKPVLTTIDPPCNPSAPELISLLLVLASKSPEFACPAPATANTPPPLPD